MLIDSVYLLLSFTTVKHSELTIFKFAADEFFYCYYVVTVKTVFCKPIGRSWFLGFTEGHLSVLIRLYLAALIFI